MSAARAEVGEQRRALHAYRCIAEVTDGKSYKTAINDVAAHIRRSGLMAALSALQRKDGAAGLVLTHLATAGAPGLEDVKRGPTLPGKVRTLPLREYMLATRELLRAAAWLKRAAQATFDGT